MMVRAECGNEFVVDLDEERPIQRGAVIAVAERIANRLEELELFAARVARLNIAGELCGTSGAKKAHPYRPTDRDEAMRLHDLITRARRITGVKPSNLVEAES